MDVPISAEEFESEYQDIMTMVRKVESVNIIDLLFVEFMYNLKIFIIGYEKTCRKHIANIKKNEIKAMCIWGSIPKLPPTMIRCSCRFNQFSAFYSSTDPTVFKKIFTIGATSQTTRQCTHCDISSDGWVSLSAIEEFNDSDSELEEDGTFGFSSRKKDLTVPFQLLGSGTLKKEPLRLLNSFVTDSTGSSLPSSLGSISTAKSRRRVSFSDTPVTIQLPIIDIDLHNTKALAIMLPFNQRERAALQYQHGTDTTDFYSWDLADTRTCLF